MIYSARAYTITLELSTDDGRTYTQTPKTLLGDVGDKVRPGRRKQIVWEAMQDAKGLAGDRCVFRVTARNTLGASYTNSVGMKFVLSPSGEFMMDSTEGCRPGIELAIDNLIVLSVSHGPHPKITIRTEK